MVNTDSFPRFLREARVACRLSQLQLSLQLGVSQRHVSFVETGRARPSRVLLLAWLSALDVPLTQGNEIMLMAGYSPAYASTDLDDPDLQGAKGALGQLLNAHEPCPALILDHDWNIQAMNEGAQWLAKTLMPSLFLQAPSSPLNLIALFSSNNGLSDSIVNLQELGPRFLSLIAKEAVAWPSLRPRVNAYAEFLDTKLMDGLAAVQSSQRGPPALTTRFRTDHGVLSFFSMFTTFGTPQDITLASLRVEHLFPCDAETRAVLDQQVTAIRLK